MISLLFTKKNTLTTKYLNLEDIFLNRIIIKLAELLYINKYIINLQKCRQLINKRIYRFGLIKLKFLKAYIKINLAKNFIQPLKSFVSASILFFKK